MRMQHPETMRMQHAETMRMQHPETARLTITPVHHSIITPSTPTTHHTSLHHTPSQIVPVHLADVVSLQREDGSFAGDEWGEVDTR